MNTVGRVQIVNGTPVLHAAVVHLLYTSQLYIESDSHSTIDTVKILIFALEGSQQMIGYATARMNFLCHVKKRNTKSYLPQFDQVLQLTVNRGTSHLNLFGSKPKGSADRPGALLIS